MQVQTISPGQALLLLLDKYSQDTTKSTTLKKLYLTGTRSKAEKQQLLKFFEDECLYTYDISFTSKTIDNDPTRRYFETHLAFETLNNNIDKIALQDLHEHYNNMMEILPPLRKKEIENIFQGKINRNTTQDPITAKEYYDAIYKAQTSLWQHLSPDNQKKVDLLLRCSYLAVVIGRLSSVKLPINIYGKGIFSEKNRGKVYKYAHNFAVTSKHLGLLKHFMPMPRLDLAFMDHESFSFLRPADQSWFVPDSKWVTANFDLSVHPFSNSISGTSLCQIRLFKYLLAKNNLRFDNNEKIADFFQAFISILLYNSGGHTIHEFTEPLVLKPVRSAMASIKGFNNINEETLFLRGNEVSFDKALTDTIYYNKNILQRSKVYQPLSVDTDLSLIKRYKSKAETMQASILAKYTDADLNSLVSTYINGSLTLINNACKQYHATRTESLLIKNKFLTEVGQLDFNGVEANKVEIQKYITRNAPKLNDLPEFVANELSYTKKQLMAKLQNIKVIVNTYSNGNKNYIVNQFNQELAKLENYIIHHKRPDPNLIEEKTRRIIQTLQQQENNYYRNLFFSCIRRKHSTLQLKINKAQACLIELSNAVSEAKQRGLR